MLIYVEIYSPSRANGIISRLCININSLVLQQEKFALIIKLDLYTSWDITSIDMNLLIRDHLPIILGP